MSSYIMASGSGLISGCANAYNHFTVYTGIAGGTKGLSVTIEGPSKPSIKYTDNHNGTILVSWMPYAIGQYNITVRYDGLHVSGSPFSAKIRSEDPQRTFIYYRDRELYSYAKSTANVHVYGRGLITALTHIKNEIIADARDAAPGRLTWSIEGPSQVESFNEGFKDGIYRLYYMPYTAGEYIIRIKYAERDVTGSPFKVIAM